MLRYRAETYRDGDGFWFVRVPELDVATQAHDRESVEFMARDLVAIMLEVDISEVAVDVVDVARPVAADDSS